jgi:hypothetical protein
MPKGSIKQALAESNTEKSYSLDEQEFNYVKNLENIKQQLHATVDLYISTAQMGFFQYLAGHKFGLDSSQKYKFDLDLNLRDEDKKIVYVAKDLG